MSSQYSSSRRSQGPRTGARRPSPKKFTRSSVPAKAPKVGFFGKLLSLLGLGGKKNSSPAQSSRGTARSTGSKERAPRTLRKPEHVEVTSPRLYIGNLSFDATESDLFELFSGIGQVKNVELVSHRDTHRSKGFGFIQMTLLEEAKRAVTDLHDKEYMGRKLVVSGAKALPESRESRQETRNENNVPTEEPSCGDSCTHTHAEPAE